LPEQDILDTVVNASYALGPIHHNKTEIVRRLLSISWAALHTSAGTLAHSILQLHHVDPKSGEYYSTILEHELKEVFNGLSTFGGEQCGDDFGWNKDSLAKLIGMGSFLKETLRLYMVGAGNSFRKVCCQLLLCYLVLIFYRSCLPEG
jgi:cytochrome P450